MIVEIRKDVVDLMKSLMVPSGTLDGLKHFQVGDENLRGDYMPGGTFDYADVVSMINKGGRWEFKLKFKATLYTGGGHETIREAAIEHFDLLCKYQNGKLSGFLPALARLATGYVSDSEQSFKVTLDPATRSFGIRGKNHKHWTVATEVILDFETWLNTSQVI